MTQTKTYYRITIWDGNRPLYTCFASGDYEQVELIARRCADSLSLEMGYRVEWETALQTPINTMLKGVAA